MPSVLSKPIHASDRVAAPLAALLLTALLGVVALTSSAAWMWWAIAILGPFTAAVCLTLVRRVRRRRGMAALGYVEQAVRMNAPLPELIEAAAQSETGGLASGLRRVGAALRSGDPVAVALTRGVPEIGRRPLALVAAGERIGRLRPTLESLVARRPAGRAPRDHSPMYLLAYPPAVLLVGLLIAWQVWPHAARVFDKMYWDFGITRPVYATWMTELTQNAGPVYVVTALGFVFVMIAWLLNLWFSWMRPAREAHWSVLSSWLILRVPVVGSAIRDRAFADAFGLLASASDARLPLTSAIDEAAQLPLPVPVRARLVGWRHGLELGMSPGDAARRAGFPPIVAGLIGPARGEAGLSSAMAFLARYYGGRYTRAMIALRAAVAPVTIVLVGVCVALFVLGMILPLIAFLDAAAVKTGYVP